MPRATVLMLGDAHRLAHQPRVADILAPDGLTVVGPAKSTGNSSALRERAGELVEEFAPDIVCFSCGPHAAEDAHAVGLMNGAEPVSLAQYERDLLALTETFRRWCGRQVAFVTTPPIVERAYAAARGGEFEAALDRALILNRVIRQYNQLASGFLGQFQVMTVMLCHELAPHLEECVGEDGVMLTAEGKRRAAECVAAGVLAVL